VNRSKAVKGRVRGDDDDMAVPRRAPRKAPPKPVAPSEPRPIPNDGEADFFAGIFDDVTPQVAPASVSVAGPPNENSVSADSKPRRRGRRGGRRRKKEPETESGAVPASAEAVDEAAPIVKPARTRHVEPKVAVADTAQADETEPAETTGEDEAKDHGKRRRRPRGGRGRRRGKKDAPVRDVETAPVAQPAVDAEDEEPVFDAEPPRQRDELVAPDELDAESMPASISWDDESPQSADRGGSDADDAADETADDEETLARPSGKPRRMLINVADSDECRIAILQEGRLDELYTERTAATSHVGNIYKGRVTNVESSIQAAFVDFGLPQHGFLHISDLHPQYFPQSKGEPELVGRKTPRRHRPPIQHCLRRGQEVIVQVIKEGIGTKGPTLTTYISLPGRFLVMMPGMDQLGVSRKIEDDEQRRKARDLLSQLSLPKEMGFIVRTAGIDRTKRDLQRDLNYLVRLWKGVEQRMEKIDAPTELYRESDLVIRTIRDVYDSTVEQVIVDNPSVAEKVREFLSIASPRAGGLVAEYSDAEPLFYRYGIEAEIDKLHSKRVDLPCGGSLVIESTEALVAIDVNSGKFRIPDNAEETAYRVNCEAVEEIARQLRLRDLGGLIICDMIDMLSERHCRDIENRFRDALKMHKERAKVLKMSRFGIIEMTRQRQRPSLLKSVFRECPRCAGTGRMKSTESVALDVMRRIRMASQRENVASVDVRVSTAVANDLLNRKRHQLTDLERAASQSIRIHGDEAFHVDQVELACTDRRGRELPMTEPDRAVPVQGRPPGQSVGQVSGSRGNNRGWQGGKGGGSRERGSRRSRGGRGGRRDARQQ